MLFKCRENGNENAARWVTVFAENSSKRGFEMHLELSEDITNSI